MSIIYKIHCYFQNCKLSGTCHTTSKREPIQLCYDHFNEYMNCAIKFCGIRGKELECKSFLKKLNTDKESLNLKESENQMIIEKRNLNINKENSESFIIGENQNTSKELANLLIEKNYQNLKLKMNQFEKENKNLEVNNDNEFIIRELNRKKKEFEENENAFSKSKNSKSQYSRNTKSLGLANLGNTCFANSVLQGIYHFDEFRQFFSKLDPKYSFTSALKDLIINIYENNRVDYYLSVFVNQAKLLSFCNGAQQDSKEFYACILDKLIDDDPSIYEVCILNKRAIYKFQRCNKDLYQKKSSDPSSNHQYSNDNFYPFIPIQCNTLEAGINEFFSNPTVTENFWCMDCQKKSIGTEEIIFDYPNILCIYFHTPNHIKIGSSFMINKENEYKIETIICRVGSDRNSGHYYTVCLESDKVVTYNDSNVSVERTLNKSFLAYMIFCRKISPRKY